MKFAHILLAGAAALMVAAPAVAETCVRPAERTALELHALQSHLAVVAIRCHMDSNYAAFVQRHRSELTGAYQASVAHFRRAYGSQGVRRFDMYSTELANAHDQDAARSEAFICRDNAGLYRQAMSGSGEQLAQLAIDRNILTTYNPETCTAAEAPSRPARRSSRSRARRAR